MMSEWLASLRTTNTMWLPPRGVVAHQVRDVHARDRGRRHRPRRRHPPVPAVDQTGRLRVGQARGLGLRQRRRRPQPRRHLPGTVALVVAQPKDVEVVVRRRRVDLELHGVARRCTLIAVANPWIVADPAPAICQSLAGVPGRVFSQAIAFTTGGPHGPAAAAGVVWAANGSTRPATAATAAITEYRTAARHGRSACETGRELRGHRSSYQR